MYSHMYRPHNSQQCISDPYAENDRQHRTMGSIFISEHQEESPMSNAANTAALLMANQNVAVSPSAPAAVHNLEQTIALDTIELSDDYTIASAQPVPSLSPSSMTEQPVFLSDLDQQLFWDTLSLPTSSLHIPSSQQSSFLPSTMTCAPAMMTASDFSPITIPLSTTSYCQLISSTEQQQQLEPPASNITCNDNNRDNDATAIVQYPTSEPCSSPVVGTPSSSERSSHLCRVSHNCRATFTRRSDRDRHELIHKPPRTLYTCEYCNTTCTRKDTLKRHQARSCPVINACNHQSPLSHTSRG